MLLIDLLSFILVLNERKNFILHVIIHPSSSSLIKMPKLTGGPAVVLNVPSSHQNKF
jgi:hypothetical protein